MKCFYHSDMDGKCAGAIVHKYYLVDRERTKETADSEFICINYKDDFPFEKIKPGELIIIVDFSLQRDGEFQKLLEITNNVIWIDHHKTAIEKHGALDIKGLRVDGIAGCELTWQYFYPNERVPDTVKLLADYDIWAFKFGEFTKKLQTGIWLYDTHPESNYWQRWLRNDYCPYEEIKKGEIAMQYRDKTWASMVKSWSFWTEIGGYKAIACNAGSVSSQLFDSITEDYDIMMPFVFDGTQWTVSLYTKKDIDVSGIAKKYGGGGHKQAAGFQCRELPFKRVIR